MNRCSIVGFTNKTLSSVLVCLLLVLVSDGVLSSRQDMVELNWHSVLLLVLGSSTLDDVWSRGEDKYSIVVSEAVVWEVRESVYNSSSSLLSSPFNMSHNCLKSDGLFDFRSAEIS